MRAIWAAFGTYTLVWGFWLLSPWWDTFKPTAAIYEEMAGFMPEWAWGVHAIFIGVVVIYGSCCSWPKGIWMGRVLGSYHWFIIALLYGKGDWHNTGMITSLFLVVLLQLMWLGAKNSELTQS